MTIISRVQLLGASWRGGLAAGCRLASPFNLWRKIYAPSTLYSDVRRPGGNTRSASTFVPRSRPVCLKRETTQGTQGTGDAVVLAGDDARPRLRLRHCDVAFAEPADRRHAVDIRSTARVWPADAFINDGVE